eukprot:CAMPEP_0183338090 /NCGR_PEP_ID=MMETSP0164_2-20130417/5508_1 /TAXON_ID=221442 /ORGANISM="Coccolithus pelagicus ssp braarudi, Strain PLY182g" /LENGTH=214 /DNA_ID=CAMNT_0025507883 /DNA_START=1 /DNA_END=645 /DNA_ORIENTATION=+
MKRADPPVDGATPPAEVGAAAATDPPAAAVTDGKEPQVQITPDQLNAALGGSPGVESIMNKITTMKTAKTLNAVKAMELIKADLEPKLTAVSAAPVEAAKKDQEKLVFIDLKHVIDAAQEIDAEGSKVFAEVKTIAEKASTAADAAALHTDAAAAVEALNKIEAYKALPGAAAPATEAAAPAPGTPAVDGKAPAAEDGKAAAPGAAPAPGAINP